MVQTQLKNLSNENNKLKESITASTKQLNLYQEKFGTIKVTFLMVLTFHFDRKAKSSPNDCTVNFVIEFANSITTFWTFCTNKILHNNIIYREIVKIFIKVIIRYIL